MSEEIKQPEEPDFYDEVVGVAEDVEPDYEAEEVEEENSTKAPPQEEKK